MRGALAGGGAALFTRLHRQDPAAVQAFEYMAGTGMEFVLRHIPGAAAARRASPHYALVELATPRQNAGLRAALEAGLEAALEAGESPTPRSRKAVPSGRRCGNCGRNIAEAQKREGASVKNDVSVPVSACRN